MQANNFTLVRLVLATLVVFGHFKILPTLSPSYGGMYDYADFAVDMFFIVSGYLVYGSFDNSPKLAGFYIKRFFRIYPLYLVVILAQMLAMLIILGDKAQLGDTLKYLGSNLIFANFISPDMGGLLAGQHNSAINPSLWTLKIEVMFYLIVPLLWWLVKRKGIVVLPLIYVASTVFVAIAIYYGAETLSKQLPAQLRFFVVGIGLYIINNRHYERSKAIQFFSMTRFIGNLLLAIILFALCSFRYVLPLMPIYPLLVGALLFICGLRLPVISLKYDISYGVYLIHAPFIQFALLFGLFEDSPRFLLLLLTIVYVLAFFVEKIVELPMVRLGKKLSERFSEKFAEKEI